MEITSDGRVVLYDQDALYESEMAKADRETLRLLLLDKRFSAYQQPMATHTDPSVVCFQYTSAESDIRNCFIDNGPEKPVLPENILEAERIILALLEKAYAAQPVMEIALAVETVASAKETIRVDIALENAGSAPVSLSLTDVTAVIEQYHYQDQTLTPQFGLRNISLQPCEKMVLAFSGTGGPVDEHTHIRAIFDGAANRPGVDDPVNLRAQAGWTAH